MASPKESPPSTVISHAFWGYYWGYASGGWRKKWLNNETFVHFRGSRHPPNHRPANTTRLAAFFAEAEPIHEANRSWIAMAN